MANTLPADQKIVRNDSDLLSATVDGELIAMSVEQGSCYAFTKVEMRIWELLAEPRSVDELVDTLGKEYEVEPDVCRSDVVAYIDSLRGEGLVSEA